MATRPWPWLAVFGIAVALSWCVLAAEEPTPPHVTVPNDTPADPSAPMASDPGLAAPVVTERVPMDGGWWVRNLSERAEEPLAPDAEDRFAPAVRGRLTVRQRPWLHPAGIEVRLTRAWLDTVLPTETGTGDQLAPAHDDVLATTDADGWFLLRFRPTSGELFFLIDRGGDWMDFQKVKDVPRPGTTLELGDVWLDDRGGITGTVVDAGGRPFAGATVRAVDDPLLDVGAGLDELRAARNRGLEHFRVPGSLTGGPLPDWVVRRDKFLPFPTATTDEHGSFRVHGLRPGVHDVFVVHDLSHGSLAGVQVAGGRDTGIGKLQLRISTGVRIAFVDEDKRPWVGAEVAFVQSDLGFGTPVLRTNAVGQIATFVPNASTCRLTFAYPGGGPWITLPWWPDRERIQVRRPPEFTVTLVDERGAVVRNGRVRFYVVGEAFRPVDRALPGHLQPVAVQPGVHRGRTPCPVVVVAAAPGFAPAIAFSGDEDSLTVTMLPIQSMTVRTIDRHGVAVPGASVRIQAHNNPEHRFPGAQWAALANDRAHVGLTDDEGLLKVPVWDTFLSLQADHPLFGPSPGPKLRPVAGQIIDLQLRRPARVHGRLLFHQRQATAGFRVRARHQPPRGHVLEGSGWLDEQLAVTGDDGTFAFRGLNAGIWEMRPELPAMPSVAGATEPGSRWKSMQVLVAEDQELHFRLEAEQDLLAPHQIVGTVRMDGLQITGALVRLREHEKSAASRLGNRTRRGPGRQPIPEPAATTPLWTHRLTTDAFGDFAFGALEPNTEYELRIDLPWQDRLQFLERRVVRSPDRQGAPPTEIAIDLRGGTLHLQCTEAGRPYRNRMLRLRQIDKDGNELARFEALTTNHGGCLAERLPSGTWVVEPMHGGRCQPAEFTIAPGSNSAASIEVLPW